MLRACQISMVYIYGNTQHFPHTQVLAYPWIGIMHILAANPHPVHYNSDIVELAIVYQEFSAMFQSL